jgi:anti-sigma B factor antagonist
MAMVHAEATTVGDAPAVALSGEVDVATAEKLTAELEDAILASDGAFVIDLSAVEFLDSSGIGALLRARGVLGRADRALVLVCPPGPVRRVLSLAGIEDLFLLFDGRAEAARRLRAS